MEPSFVDWEARPAVRFGARAWVVPLGGSDWEEANFAEVGNSGSRLPDEATWRAAFPEAPAELPAPVEAARRKSA